ncbi:hybrid sensor histidine kinase/response regulator transcription factor [Parabacteroides gordonii]|uniref:hybrid sensor histidine kinase/response regulator transcription factor n=1 Tax=Parabacteroides gordonii TaxID=574930 RepID=UPI00216B3036|nr:hybrid sensor histidine kinase/response regulator transcription factor [Parabacteroides gordonii]
MVKCVLTDHKGIIWIGTHLGLNSFDREKIKTYYHDKKDPCSIPDNNIHFMVEDSLLNLWVSTGQGMALYDREKDIFHPVLFNENQLKIQAYVSVKDGLLLFGKGEFYKYNYSDRQIVSLPIHATEDACIWFEKACGYHQSDNLILLASRWNGLWEYNDRTGALRRSSLVKDYQIAALLIDSSDNLWLSPYGKGLVGYDRTKKEICRLHASRDLSNGIILDIKEREGKLWLATDGGGINIYDKENGTVDVINHVPGKSSSLPVNSFWCLYNDPDNNMWAGSIRGGLIGMKEIYMRTYQDVFLNSAYGLSEKAVSSMYEDLDNMIWLGTDGGGMNRLDPHTGLFRHYPSTYPSKIVSIIDYNATELLYSGFGEGLFLLNKQTGKVREYPVINTDKHNTLFKSGKSVHLFRLDEMRFYLLADSVYLYDQSARKLTTVDAEVGGATFSSLNLITREKNVSYLWGENDLFVLDHTRNNIRVLHSFADSIGVIAAATKGQGEDIWIGTSVGLYRFHPEKKTLSPIENDRFLGTTSLGFDKSGRLWIGTHNGLYAYMPDDGKIMMFGESDGVYANEYIAKPPLITGDGDIYMAGMMGLVHIENDLPFPENPDPVIGLLDVILNGASAGSAASRDGNMISVPWNYTSLIAKVIVRENDLMRKKLFRYYIKGTQEEMVESSNHTIAFHALSVGKYEIWVSCNKKNGDWSVPVKLLSVEVMPPWWRTNWFLFCCVLVAVAGLSVVFWLVMKRQETRMIWAMKEHEQRTYEEKIRFLINLNHELRTPLTLIYSPLKRLLNSGEIDNAAHSRQLEDILKQTRRVKDIIDMVLDVRKMETGTETLSIGSHKLNDWIREVADAFKEELLHKNINLEYQLDGSVGEVPFDAAKCEIVLSNLIMNALKFSNANTCITVSSHLEEDYVRVSVSDQGIGLDNVDITRLFERFYQGTHDRHGTGIGLSYARLLVEMHGGRIGAANNAGKGATFFYELPLNNTTTSIVARPYLNELLVSSGEKNDTAVDFSVRKYSVLVVEDEPELRNYLKVSLKESFRQVYVAGDGVEGFDMAIRHLPDIIISDVMMPRMDGFEFCRLLKSNLEVSHIPVILLTARTDQASTVQGYKEGADFYLPKPFDLEFLLAIVRNLLKNREAVKLRYKEGGETVSPKEDTISNADEQFVKKLNDLIREQLENPELDVNFVATQMAMSRASLYNKLKALTGVSIGDYINKFRMARVMELLADKELSLLEISEKAGFTNQRYFSTVFKQAYGTTPSKYRQEHFS